MKYYEDCMFFSSTPKYDTVISIVDEDTFTLASRYKDACCLNFASHKRPGGGYEAVRYLKMPIRTQEEDLFRRSNLPELMDNEEHRQFYPLKPLAGFYHKCTVLYDKNLGKIEPFTASIITVPAVVNPDTLEKMALVEKKAKMILNIAAENCHKVLILGAWGCGVFNNDPLMIAKLFKKLLTNEFNGIFEEVLFAIPNKNSDNYRLFESVL